MKWLAGQEQISALPGEWSPGDVGSKKVERDRCALSQSTIRVLKTQGLKSVGGSQSGKRGRQLAFGRLGLSLLSAITAFGQLAPSLSVGLKLSRSGPERKRAPWASVQAAGA